MEINEHIKSWYVQWLYIESLYSKYAGRYHLTRATMTALDEIYHHEDGCSQKDICQVLNIPKQTVSSVMGNLEKKGFVYKKECVTDKRLHLYYLTPSGCALCEEIIASLDKIEFEAFNQLSQKDREDFTRINVRLTQLIEQGMNGGENNGNTR